MLASASPRFPCYDGAASKAKPVPREGKMKGYGGRIGFVDLTSGSARVETVSEEMARQLIGGNGFAVRLLLDNVPAGVDPFDAANAVVFAVGPITDTSVPGNSRACVAA